MYALVSDILQPSFKKNPQFFSLKDAILACETHLHIEKFQNIQNPNSRQIKLFLKLVASLKKIINLMN